MKLLKKFFFLLFLLIFFSFLLIFPSQSLEASKSGLLLWFDTLLPSLLPFLILSQLLLKTGIIETLQKLYTPVFQKLFHCSSDGAFCILCGFLCGYPVGARLISLQMKENRIDPAQGQHLLSFCNNVSPMFCISYGIRHAIGSANIFPYVLILYGAPILLGYMTRPASLLSDISVNKKQTSEPENIFQLIDVCIIDSFLIMIKLCGYIILFSIISSGILLLFPKEWIFCKAVLISALEITNGLSLTSGLPKGILRSAISIFALSFGGICCIFQTSSVIADTGLSLKKYTFHKIVSSILALFLFVLWLLLQLFFRLISNRWC